MKLFNTIYGEVQVTPAMFDIDGTNLEEGIELKLLDEGSEVIEVQGYTDIDELTINDVENLIEANRV